MSLSGRKQMGLRPEAMKITAPPRLRAVNADLPVRLVAATRSKAARAEPIALRFETGRAKLAGAFAELEDQMCALTWAVCQGAGSPNRVDAMVLAMTELFEKEPSVPRVRGL